MKTKCPICDTKLGGPLSGMMAHIGVRHIDVSLVKLSEAARKIKGDFHTVLGIRKITIDRYLHPSYENSRNEEI